MIRALEHISCRDDRSLSTTVVRGAFGEGLVVADSRQVSVNSGLLAAQQQGVGDAATNTR